MDISEAETFKPVQPGWTALYCMSHRDEALTLWRRPVVGWTADADYKDRDDIKLEPVVWDYESRRVETLIGVQLLLVYPDTQPPSDEEVKELAEWYWEEREATMAAKAAAASGGAS